MNDIKLENEIKNIYIKFFRKNPHKEINSKYIKDQLSNKTLKEKFSKINIYDLLSNCEINPATVSTKTVKTPAIEENKNFLKDLLEELIKKYGIENLNDLNMNSSKKIQIPDTLLPNKDFPLTNQLNVKPKKIRLASIQRRCFRHAKKNNWRHILEIAEIPIEKVERKKANIDINETLEDYLKLKKKYKIKNISEVNHDILRKDEPRIYKKIFRINDDLDFEFSRFNIFFNGLLVLEYFQHHKKLPSIQDLDSDKNFELFKNYLFNQKQINWSLHPEVIQSILLELYAKGSKIHDQSKSKNELKLTNHFRWSKTKSNDLYKRNGILIKNLQKINHIIDTGYDRKKIYKKFQELLTKTIQTDVNHLSKEHIEKHEKEFMNACFVVEGVKTNNWGKILEIYGLNPENFIYDFSFVSKRGFIFERSINDLFVEYLSLKESREKLIKNHDYWYKKRIKNIGVPDFNFKSMIIDTKFSIGISKGKFNHESISNQIKKYKLLKKDIVILTFNQKTEIRKVENNLIKIINFKNLRSFIKNEFEIEIEKKKINFLFDKLNKINKLL